MKLTQRCLQGTAGCLLLSLVGCSSLGTPFARWSGRDDSKAPSLFARSSSERSAPARSGTGTHSGPISPPEEASRPITAETRSHVALAMGEMYESAGNLPGAQLHYEQVLKADPKSLQATLALGRIYARLGRPDAAMKVYEAAEKHHRKNASLPNDKGLLLAEQKNWPAAIESLQQAVKLDPENSKYHNNLGMVLAASGAYEEAYQEFRQAVGPGPAHYNIAMMLLQAGEVSLARDRLLRALDTMPTLKEAEHMLAQLSPPPAATQAPIDPAPEPVALQTVGHLQVPAPAEPTTPSQQQTISVAPVVTPTAQIPREATKHSDPWAEPWTAPKWLR